MKTLNKFLHISLGVAVVISFFSPNISTTTAKQIPSLVKTAQAQTTPVAHPDGFQGTLRDHQCSDQEVAPWTTATPGGYFYTTDSNAKDPDCGRLNFMTQNVSQVPAAQSIYTDDFRVGIQIAESGNDNLTSCQPGQFIQQSPIAYTPWASEGGGASVNTFTQYPNNDPDCYLVYYDTRPWPSGTPNIKDVQFGVSLGNGAMQFTPWARSGGGWSGYSAGGNIKPARIQMNITPIDLYDAQYSSDTVPDNMNQSQTGTYNVVVQNKATSWISDNQPSDSCQSQTPTADGQTCQATVNVSSNTIRLKRVDSDTGITTPATGAKVTYARSITRNYTASYICVQWGVAMHDERKPSNLFGLIKQAHALMPIPGDGTDGGGGDPGPVCTGYGYQYALTSQTPANNNVVNTDTASFPMAVTIAAGASTGIHTLQFKMVQTDTNGNEISTGTYQGAFTTPFNINITVGTPYTLTCDATHTVTSGTTAQYAISAAGVPNGNVSVTMTSNPTGPVMIDAPIAGMYNPLILSGGKTGNGYAGIAYVSTSSVPQGTYVLTFSGVDATPTTVTCQSQLIVNNPDPTVDLKFAAPGGRASDGPVTLQDQTSGTASWVSTNAVSCTATSDPALDTKDWDGIVATNSPKGGQSVTGFQYGTGYTLSIDCVNSLGTHVIDAVNVSVNATNPSVTMLCDPGTGTYGAGPCTVVQGASGYLEWTSSFAVSCSINNGIGSVPINQATPFSTGNLSANTTYTITCTGQAGTTPATSSDLFNVLIPPQKAGGPTVDNQSICSKMVVNWTYTGPPTADGFEVYWSNTSTSGPWTLISPAIGAGGALDGNARSFTHNNPAANSNYYMVRSYHSGLYADSNGVGPTGTQSCAPNLTTSDKEVLQLQRGSSVVKNKASQDCNGQSDVFTLPSNGLFRTGDIITFKINVCNTGNQTLTGVSVRDTLSNLSSAGTATFYPGGCGSGSYPNFSLANIPPPDPKLGETNKICSVTFTAKVTAPSSTSSLYRFQNSADIGSNEAAFTVTTPPYLFQVGAGIPVRNETNK